MRGPAVSEGRHRAPELLASAPALTAAAWTIGLLTTGVVVGTPFLVFGVVSLELHLVLDSVDACIAFLLAYLLHGRYQRSRQLQDLLLTRAMLFLGVAGLGLALATPTLNGAGPQTLDVWLPLFVRVLGAVLVVSAAMVGRSPVPRRWSPWVRHGPWVVLAVGTAVLWLARDLLPLAVAATPPASAARPLIEGHPVLIASQALSATCFLVASVAFTRQARHNDDELLLFLGPACALGGFARINYVLFPSLYADWIYTGDVLRTASYLVLLIGAGREISRYWAIHAQTAVREDRRRLSRELHDGLVQELSYIRAEAYRISSDDGLRQRIHAACDRATDEARAAIEALTKTSPEPLGVVLHQAARQVAERYGGDVDVQVDDTVDAAPEQRHALVRIAREAISNAIRHGDASRVVIRVERVGRDRRLVLEDDGHGFDMSANERTGGFGLTSMRDRAAALPGSLRVESRRGHGTTVEVTW